MNKKSLTDQLAALGELEWQDVLHEALEMRRGKLAAFHARPKDGTSRDEVAAWVARHHMSGALFLQQVIYLPHKAPPEEIRLLEVTSYPPFPDEESLQVWDLSPAAEDLPYQVLVVDASPEQWGKIKAKKIKLPKGWSLGGYQTFGRETTS